MAEAPTTHQMSSLEARVIDRYVDKWMNEGKSLADALREIRAATNAPAAITVAPQANGLMLQQQAKKEPVRIEVPATTKPDKTVRTPFMGALPSNDRFFDDLKPTAVSERLCQILIEYGQENYFTTPQLWAIGLGAMPSGENYGEAVDKFNGGKTRMKRLLEARGFKLGAERLQDGTKHWKYWTERE